MKILFAPAAIALAFASVSPAAAVNCPALKKPVCAVAGDGHRSQFDSACLAEQKGYRVLHPNQCEAAGSGPMMCNELYQPVCATDPSAHTEKTYPNLCHAEVANAALIHDGECAPAKPPG